MPSRLEFRPGRPNIPHRERKLGKETAAPTEPSRAGVCKLTQQKMDSIFTLIKSADVNVPVSAPGRYCGSEVLHSRTSIPAAFSPVLRGSSTRPAASFCLVCLAGLKLD